jgi:glycosyltransferase involved in cell wall biosynthesis
MPDRKSSAPRSSKINKYQDSEQKQREILVVVPTLGERTDYLRLTLQSIADQAPVLYDIVLVCPLTNKDTKKLAEEFGASRVDDPGGLSASVNAGIAQAKSWHKYISWIGDDDLLSPRSFAITKAALESNSAAVLAFGYCEYIDADGHRIFTSRAGRLAPWLMTWGPDLVPMPGLLLRKSSLKEVGEFDTNNKYCMDLEMLLRLRKHGKFVCTGKTLAAFRWHANSTTVANRDLVLRETKIVKRRSLSKPLRSIAPLWEGPVWLATKLAVRYVDSKAKTSNP